MMKVLVVTKKSAFELYSAAGDPGVRAFLKGGTPEVARIERSHRVQVEARDRVMEILDKKPFEVAVVSRGELRSARGVDLVVTVGGDGTFLEASHGVRDEPMLGVNADPEASVGFFCTATARDLAAVLEDLDTMPRTILHRLEVAVEGRPIAALALNDVFYAHANPAAVSRYRVRVNGRERYVKSSGFLVSTAAGSTAWMYQEGGVVIPIGDRRIQYLSRSVRGEKPAFAAAITLHSLTREARLYIDGISRAGPIPLGAAITLGPGRPLTVIGDLETKRDALE